MLQHGGSSDTRCRVEEAAAELTCPGTPLYEASREGDSTETGSGLVTTGEGREGAAQGVWGVRSDGKVLNQRGRGAIPERAESTEP